MNLTQTSYQFLAFQVAPAGEMYEKEFISLVASVESLSNHSMAQAVVDVAKKNNFPTYPVIGFKEFPEQGLGGAVEKEPNLYRAVVVGSRQFIKDLGFNVPETIEVAARRWETEGAKVSMGGWDGWVRGVLKFTPAE